MKLLKSIYCEQFKGDCESCRHDFCLEKKDFDTLFKCGGLVYMREIITSIYEIKNKVNSMLEEQKKEFNGGKVALVHFQAHPNAPFKLIMDIMEIVGECLGDDVDIFCGLDADSKCVPDYLTFGIMIGGIMR